MITGNLHMGNVYKYTPLFFYEVYFNIFNGYLSYEKNTFADNLRVEPTIIFMENIVFFETFL